MCAKCKGRIKEIRNDLVWGKQVRGRASYDYSEYGCWICDETGGFSARPFTEAGSSAAGWNVYAICVDPFVEEIEVTTRTRFGAIRFEPQMSPNWSVQLAMGPSYSTEDLEPAHECTRMIPEQSVDRTEEQLSVSFSGKPAAPITLELKLPLR